MKRLIILTVFLALVLSACSSGQAPNGEMPVYDTGIDPNSWVDIPASEYYQGLNQHLLNLDYDYKIMVTNVTNQQYADFLNKAISDGTLSIKEDGVWGFYEGDEFNHERHEVEIPTGDKMLFPIPGTATDTDNMARLTFDGSTFKPIAEYENHPVTMVTWFGANAYCRYYDGRLPLETEWEKAARGEKDKRAYPWGDEEPVENIANYYASHDPFEIWTGQRQGDTTPVGFYNGQTYPDGYQTSDQVSPYGVYDMAGNVWEWTGAVYEGTHQRYMRGGSKDTYGFNSRVWSRNSAPPDYYSPAVGFRCVQSDYEPEFPIPITPYSFYRLEDQGPQR